MSLSSKVHNNEWKDSVEYVLGNNLLEEKIKQQQQRMTANAFEFIFSLPAENFLSRFASFRRELFRRDGKRAERKAISFDVCRVIKLLKD